MKALKKIVLLLYIPMLVIAQSYYLMEDKKEGFVPENQVQVNELKNTKNIRPLSSEEKEEKLHRMPLQPYRQIPTPQKQEEEKEYNLELKEKKYYVPLKPYEQTIESPKEKKKYKLETEVKKETIQEKLSKIEEEFSSRSNLPLRQFGYEFFKTPLDVSKLALPVNENYRLGPGDELVIYIVGLPADQKIPSVIKTIVDREGNISIPNLGVFNVWGLTLKETEEMLRQELGLDLKVTVGRIRTFIIYVAGEVNRPGAHIATAVNTVIDALSIAGGVKKTGSLRNILLTRKTPYGLKIYKIDLYKVFVEGKPIDLTLRDGDTILVKPIGPTVGIAGEVKRPAIYEIKGGETIEDLLKLAGGLLPSSYKYKVILQRYKNGKLEIIEDSLTNKNFLNTKLKDGDLVIVKKSADIPENSYSLEGYVTLPGVYEYKKGLKLSQVLNQDLFFKDTNLKFAVLIRQYPKGSIPQYIAFSPERVLEGKEDLELKPYDRLIFFKLGEDVGKKINLNLVKNYVLISGYYKYTGPVACTRECFLSDILRQDLLLKDTNLDYAEIERYDSKTLQRIQIIKFKPKLVLNGIKDIKLQSWDRVVFYPNFVYEPIKISGEVERPAWVTYKPGITLEEAISRVKFKAPVRELKAVLKQGNKVEVYYLNMLRKNPSPLAFVRLEPGAEIVIKRVKKDEVVTKVFVYGQVWRPGVYKIDEHTTLYDVLKAAGGFKPTAYPKGLVLLRDSIAQMQRERLKRALVLLRAQLEKEIAGYMQAQMPKEQKEAYKEAFTARRRLLEEMEKTQITGRLVGLKIPFNLEALKNSPYNIVLEDGDMIYVPKKPSAVLVFGEVQNPSAILYKPGLTVKDYISLSGGFTKDADVDNIFIIKANGVAISRESGKSLIEWDSENKRFIWGWAYNDILNYKLEPGDAIIVPTKIKIPVIWRPLIRDVIQIIYQSALTVYTITKL